jgi:Fur family ferric uptake transcriptional regulator
MSKIPEKKVPDTKKNEGYEKVKKTFIQYLDQTKHRKTPERFNILKEIFNYKGHFDVDSLYFVMKSNKYRVSRATIYNTVELLIDCKLLIKHQFGEKFAVYEQTFEVKHHDHFICIECNTITEFTDTRLVEIEKDITNSLNATSIRHSYYIYGICHQCKTSKKK